MSGWKGLLSALCRNALLVTFAVTGAHAETTGGQTIDIPCMDFNVGDTWEYKTIAPGYVESSTQMVRERDGDKVLVVEKKTQKVARPHPRAPDPPAMTSTWERQYQVEDSMIVVTYQKMDFVQSFFEPPMPVCGKVPVEHRSSLKNSIRGGQTAPSEVQVILKLIGREKLTVPAGTFDVVVVESGSKADSPAMPAAGGGSFTITTYFAPGVGIVKTVIAGTTLAPTKSGATDPQAEAVFQQGLEKLQKGERPDEAFAQLEALAPEVQMQEVKSQTVMELQRYLPGKP